MADPHGERLARIETKVDALLAQRGDHEIRLRTLEGWRHKVLGLAAASGAAAGFLAEKLWPLLPH